MKYRKPYFSELKFSFEDVITTSDETDTEPEYDISSGSDSESETGWSDFVQNFSLLEAPGNQPGASFVMLFWDIMRYKCFYFDECKQGCN